MQATLTLDRAAAEQVPDLARQQRVGDLRQAGWRVDGPKRDDEDGSVELRAVKAFSSAAGATRAVEELTGPDGAFRRFQLTRSRTFLKTRTGFSGTVDLSRGLDGFIDPVLRERLGGSGLDFPTLERQLGLSLFEVFGFTVRADLPGQVSADGARGRPVWEPKLGQTVALEASAEQWNVVALASALTAVISAAALVVVLVRRSSAVSWS